MSRADRDDLFFHPPGTVHYNIQLTGGALWNWVTARYFEGLDPAQIEWVWMVEARYHATRREIKHLCAGKTGA
jgi:hypothetical protein